MHGVSRRQFFLTTGSLTAATFLRARDGEARQAGAARPKVTLACADYLRFTPLATGDLRPKDLDLTWVRGDRSEMLRRAISDATVDGGEGSMLQHLLRVDSGDRSMVALPVFPLRNFTARDLYARKGTPVSPTHLNGRRLGIYNWAASGAVWYRHFLRNFGQDPASMKWVVGGTDEPARVEARAPLPPHVTDAPPGASLSDLLLAGELYAIFVPLPPKKYHPANGPIIRVIPDFRSAEKLYFKETGCFPPQHVLLLREATWKKDPSIGRRILYTFTECETVFATSQRLYPYATPWLLAEVEETEMLMGPDFHAHGLEKNRRALDVFCQSAFEDGLTRRRVKVEEFFAEFLRG